MSTVIHVVCHEATFPVKPAIEATNLNELCELAATGGRALKNCPTGGSFFEVAFQNADSHFAISAMEKEDIVIG